MAQKNPPKQHAFLATALERELLARIGKDGTLTAEEIVGSLPNPAAAWNAPRSKAEIIKAFPDERSTLAAIEGCLAKHFIIQDKTARFVLTESGKRQL